jgi:putative flippase GtrA
MRLVGFSSLQGLKYALTSAGTFSFNLLVVWLCGSVFGIFYLAAVAIGFGAETTLLYGINRTWTFRGVVATTIGAGYARAWLVALSTLGLVLLLEWILVSLIDVNYFAARVLISPIAYVWSYLLDGSFTFRVLRFTR